MEVDRHPETTRSVSFTVTAMGLVTIAGVMTVLFVVTSRRAAAAEGDVRSYMLRLAWLSAALLALCLLLLFWVVVRHARFRITQQRQRSETPYIDAWAEAGKRFQLAGDDLAEDEDEQDDKDEPDKDEGRE